MSFWHVLLKIGQCVGIGCFWLATVVLTLFVVKVILTLLKDWSKNKNIKSMLKIIVVSAPIVAYCAFLFWLGVLMCQHI